MISPSPTLEVAALPRPRGPLSRAVIDSLRTGDPAALTGPGDGAVGDPVADDDLQLALWVIYELQYRGFTGVDARWEGWPGLTALWRRLEGVLLDDLRRRVPVPPSDRPVAVRLFDLVAADDGPSLARFVQRRADRKQLAEILVHRSIYQLKEADPHTWALPRLSGRAKAALVEIQADEYGQGVRERMHCEMFRATLSGLDLDTGYAAYVDAVPGITLALTNVMSLFGLRPSLVGALVGHLGAYEMCSSGPSRRMAAGLRRLGLDDAACAFYDEHVTADALHEQIAAHDLCGGLAETRPDLAESILFGAAVSLYVDHRFADHVLAAFAAGRSSLRALGAQAVG